MSRSLGNVIADSLQLSLGYAERLLKNVPADRAGRFAAPGGVVVESNHPTFIYGHLSLYAPKILRLIGHPAPPIPDGFELVFSKDAKCVDDVDGVGPATLENLCAFIARELQPALPLLVRVAVFRPASGDRATLTLG